MSGDHQLRVVLCWHMHQPDYRDPTRRRFLLPWVYLHGIKDYADMAFHLEQNPDARAVVNFSPVLLEQVQEYVHQLDAWLTTETPPGDALLAALTGPELPQDPASRAELMATCARVNREQIVRRHPQLKQLLGVADSMAKMGHPGSYAGDGFLVDLVVWYHLAWLGESVRENDPVVESLTAQRSGFTTHHRRQLVILIKNTLADLVPRYRLLADEGRIELSVTPLTHPILPLLLDFSAATAAMPGAPLPSTSQYPDGVERAQWQIEQGIEVFERHFGHRPRGCWPAEGAICSDTARLLSAAGFEWIASGQQVLRNSLQQLHGDEALPEHWMHQAYRVSDEGLRCFFRDDGLSDLIGFTYANWHADDAVGNLVGHLEQIAQETAHRQDTVVSVIMDGENAWEYYPFNGSFFLGGLYERLAEHPNLHLTTFGECLDHDVGEPHVISDLVPGSWVYGTLSTWIGEADKNRAWDMLSEAKLVFDRYLATHDVDEPSRSRLLNQLAVCEGSDWFWWFGDYNPADSVSDFESLFRRQLSCLYELLDEPAPAYLQQVFTRGKGRPDRGGVMRSSHGAA